MRESSKTTLEKYDKGITMHFAKSKYDNCKWNKNTSTWSMLKKDTTMVKETHKCKNCMMQNIHLFHVLLKIILLDELIQKIDYVVNDIIVKNSKTFSDTILQVENASSRQNIAYSFGTDFLSFPPHFCNFPIVLHELTHTIVDRLQFVVAFNYNYTTHGRMFAFIYLELVRKFMGERSYTILYKNFNVKYRNRITNFCEKENTKRKTCHKPSKLIRFIFIGVVCIICILN